VQWHPTILSKLAIVPQSAINAYSQTEKGDKFTPGDLVVRFVECDKKSTQNCYTEAKPFEQQWRTSFKNA
jgi:mannan polymerase II complex MNN11 subunit